MLPARAFALFLVATAVAAAAPALEREVRRSFAVQPGCTLKIDSYRALLLVEESDGATIDIAIALDAQADSEATARRLREGVQLDFQQNGNAVTLRATNP